MLIALGYTPRALEVLRVPSMFRDSIERPPVESEMEGIGNRCGETGYLLTGHWHVGDISSISSLVEEFYSNWDSVISFTGITVLLLGFRNFI
ncbi:hypothetical protein EV356DRAFT_157113 [Viridothelium virens]|uniref:Uncharacterized protein n=1 Tax=Viridothelium virens TaxID=1048519 RepID=A0A6A6H8V8_VIRVR|nr:hypothetical protein EV356DRAFT_157113 [Viridothelium virens]